MTGYSQFKLALLGTACLAGFTNPALAETFSVPQGDLRAALNAYSNQAHVQLMVSDEAVKGVRSQGVTGDFSADTALSRILKGSGFTAHRIPSGAIGIVRDTSRDQSRAEQTTVSMQLAQATTPRASVETVTVTSSKLGGADVQSVPIAITALSQEQLTSQQIAGGPDLIKSVPNLTFSKTNFSGYNIQIRGIGTQAISVTTDPAVAVAFNDTPFIRNHFFEQEFFDVSQVEVLRGPQGTLYGRNATAGVVNVVSAKPTDRYEAMASVDVGNYNNRRLEGMLNVPIIGDKLGLRVAGEWTKRDGYSFNATTDKPIDGRDLWSGRVTVGFRPVERLQVYGVWEHFSEDDDRVRSAKQLCKKDPGPDTVDGLDLTSMAGSAFYHAWLSQGCKSASMYSDEAFQTPNGQSIPFVALLEFALNGVGTENNGFMMKPVDPYASLTQSRDLRVIESDLSPTYRARNDVFQLNADLSLTPTLTLTSQTAYGKDEMRSTQDFNRFNTAPGIFSDATGVDSWSNYEPAVAPGGVYCDPQLGCSTKMVGQDLSRERAWQFNQEVRLTSNFSGPFNFSVGANYMHYQTVEDYFVFFNLLTASVQILNKSGVGDFTHCYTGSPADPTTTAITIPPTPFLTDIFGGVEVALPAIYSCSFGGGLGSPGTYIDPNPISNVDGNGHNYFRSQNPYRLNSFAGFGEAYYQVTPDLKLTAGLRWTDDSKRFWNYPSQAFIAGGGFYVQSVVDQGWKEWTGRFNATWTPKLDFTDQTMVYASYARGYKGGGANPPGPQADLFSLQSLATHPPTFEPEYINAFEIGTKNGLLDGRMTLNASAFFYDYKGYQISQIVDRTSINLNFDAKVKGMEVEATWEPLPGLRFNFAGGLEDSSINKGQSAIDLIDRTAGHSDWLVVKPYFASTSNCILPASVVRQIIQNFPYDGVSTALFHPLNLACEYAYHASNSILTAPDPHLTDFGVVGFDPANSPNNGAGFSKDLSGNKLPNTPPFTLSAGAQYSMPISESWAATLRGDLYWQGNSYARIFNSKPYDQIHGYSTANLALILTNQDGWQAMAYVKNVFDKTAITGAFLNSDDTALTTNIFVTDPRLFGIRITKNW